MANAIPPLMCNTPPPMDGGCFGDDDEDDLSMAESIHDGMCSCGMGRTKNQQWSVGRYSFFCFKLCSLSNCVHFKS